MQLQLTKNNHFKFGFDQPDFSARTSPTQTWTVNYGSIERPVQDWKSECLIAAKQIAETTSKQIYVCFSGGIDSEVAIESFRLAGIPVVAAIMRFKNGLNSHDISWAEKYCRRHQIRMEYYDVDVNAFYQSQEYREVISATNCFYPMLSLQMKIMEWVAQNGGFPVVGSAECYVERLPTGNWVLFEREIYASLYRFQILKNFEGVCGFFQWSPEIMYSFLIDPMIGKLVAGEIFGKTNSLEIKQHIYGHHFLTELRPKYYGWEQFGELEQKLRMKLLSRFSYAQGEAKTPFDVALKILNGRGF